MNLFPRLTHLTSSARPDRPTVAGIAALTLDQRHVRLYDLAACTWTTLPVPSGADPVWSSDSRYLYIHASLDPAQPIDRISIPDANVTELVRLADSRQNDAVDFAFGVSLNKTSRLSAPGSSPATSSPWTSVRPALPAHQTPQTSYSYLDSRRAASRSSQSTFKPYSRSLSWPSH